MKRLFIPLFFLITLNLTCQTFSASLSDSIIISYENKDGTAISEAPSLQYSYVIEASKKETGYLEIILKSSKNDAKNETFSLKPLSLDLFVPKFKIHYKNLIQNSENTTFKEEEFNESYISILFARLVSFERTEEQRPIVANISLKDNIPVVITYFVKDENESDGDSEIRNVCGEKTKFKKHKHVAEINNPKVELTFYNGFIEKVELETKVYGTPVRFSNLFSIGISSSKGIRKFTNHKLQSFFSYTFNKVDSTIRKSRVTDCVPAEVLEINFSDIIDYDREIDINANDISPEPTKLVLDGIQKSTKLYKPESTKLFEAVVYSDFFGVFDEESPNGIIQTEVSKKFYINTKRKSRKWYSYIFPPSWYSDAVGVGEYINLNARFTKIEENNKFLKSEEVNDLSFFSPLRIKQHESFSIGGDVNLLSFENQNRKINTYIDLGWNYGRSGLEFSEQNQEFLNTITGSANIAFHFIPEKRYGFIASNRISRFVILNDELIERNGFSLASLDNTELSDSNDWLNSTEIEFYLNTSSTGKLFIRYTLITELDNWDNNFSQFQFGYSFFILRQNGKFK